MMDSKFIYFYLQYRSLIYHLLLGLFITNWLWVFHCLECQAEELPLTEIEAWPSENNNPGLKTDDTFIMPQDIFHQAEVQFHSGNLLESKKLYQRVIIERLVEQERETSLYRLGEIEFENKFYVSSISYLNLLLEHHPSSTWISKAKFLIGKSHFELNHFQKAQKIIEDQLEKILDPNKRMESIYYLGRLEEKRLNYFQALSNLKHVYEKSLDDSLRLQSLQVAEKIIMNHLGKGEMESMIQNFKKGFPVDILLFKVISLLRQDRETEKYKAALRQFLDIFPTHQRRLKVEQWLEQTLRTPNPTIKIGVLLPLTGQRAVTGQQVLQGIQLAFNQLKASESGSLELLVVDSGNSKTFFDKTEAMASDPDVVGIIGPLLSSNLRVILPLIEEYKILMFSPTASASGLTGLSPYFFRNALTRKAQAKFIARYAFNKLDLRRFVVFFPDEGFGEELNQAFSEEVEALGADVVARVSYDRAQTDFKNQILDIGGISDNELKKITLKKLSEENLDKYPKGERSMSKPVIEKGVWNEENVDGLKVSLELNYDAIFIPGFYDKVGLIVPQLVFYNLDQVTLLGTNGWNHPDLIDTAGRFLKNKGVFVDGFFRDSNKPEIFDFINLFKTSFGIEPSIISAQAYDASKLILDLIRNGAVNRSKVYSRIKKVKNFPGVSGETTILSNGESEKKLFALKIRGKKFVAME